MTQQIKIESLSGPYVTIVEVQEKDLKNEMNTVEKAVLKEGESIDFFIWGDRQILITEKDEDNE